jgi:hypothetical protein
VSSFMLVGTGATLMEVFEQTIGNAVQAFRTSGLFEGGGEQALRELYARLPSCDFSRHVLEPQTPRLSVVAAPPCGWTDVGTPARLMMLLRESRRLDSATQDAPVSQRGGEWTGLRASTRDGASRIRVIGSTETSRACGTA